MIHIFDYHKNLLRLTFNTSSNTGFMVCFLTLVLRFPLLLLSGNRYTFTYLKNNSKRLEIGSMNAESYNVSIYIT